jgi:hypothetical protein
MFSIEVCFLFNFVVVVVVVVVVIDGSCGGVAIFFYC